MEKRINEGYEIIQSIQVGSKEFVLGVHSKAPDQFVTWECTNKDDYDWGHYTNTLLKATKDLCKRAMKEIKYLEEKEAEKDSYQKKQKKPRKRKVQKDRDEER